MRAKSQLFALALLLVGCGEEQEYAGVEFEVQSAPPTDVKVQSDSIEVPAGVAVRVYARIRSSGAPYGLSDHLSFVGKDSDLVDVALTAQERQVFLVGKNPGRTCLEVRINRALVDCIPFEVPSQE